MSSNDYMALLRKRNKSILMITTKALTIRVDEFEKQIRLAFEAGVEEGKNTKSYFEQVFGK